MDKYITIHRKLPFNHENRKELEDWFADAVVSVGSYFVSSGSYRPASGLSLTEEKLLLPDVLSIAAEDKITFLKARDKFYHELDTPIPRDGCKLNIGLEDNDKKISEDNLPRALEDYVRYRHIIKHPDVALNKLEGERDPLKRFWIEDPDDVIKQQRAANEAKDLAMSDYLQIKGKEEKVDQVLTAMGVNPDNLSDKLHRLRQLSEERPADFHKIVNDPDLALQYEIERMVQHGVLDRVHQRFVLPGTAEEIAGNMREMILWMKDKKKSKDVNILRVQLREYDRTGTSHHGADAVSGTEQQSQEKHPARAD